VWPPTIYPARFHWSRTRPGAVNARAGLNHRPLPSYKHHLRNVILTIVELWSDIAADLLRLIGGAVTKAFIAAALVAGFVLLLGVLPWQDALANLPASTTEWWFRPALVLAAYAILIGAAVWNRRKVEKDG
jgi:hypothetical protein